MGALNCCCGQDLIDPEIDACDDFEQLLGVISERKQSYENEIKNITEYLANNKMKPKGKISIYSRI